MATQRISAVCRQTALGLIPESWDEIKLKKYIDYIKSSLDFLYVNEKVLFDNDLCERCLVFRFANYLQIKFNNEYRNDKIFVDCDYNSSCYFDESSKRWERRSGKPIFDQRTGKIKKRFIDIIVHKRESNDESDLICFEVKKWNNCTVEGVKKDQNNLIVLTSHYSYLFGFHLILGKIKEEVRLNVFSQNKKIEINLYNQ
jgi:hypothetical protein